MADQTWQVRRFLIFLAIVLAPLILSAPARALSYNWVEHNGAGCKPACLAIAASGAIGINEMETFAAFVATAPAGRKLAKVLLIHSGGGNRYGGMSMGLLLRRLGYAVVVAQGRGTQTAAGFCASACVYILAGGTNRLVPKGSVVAVHSARLIQNSFSDRMSGTHTEFKYDASGAISEDERFYRTVGVDPGLAKFEHQTPNNELRHMTPAELARFRLARAR